MTPLIETDGVTIFWTCDECGAHYTPLTTRPGGGKPLAGYYDGQLHRCPCGRTWQILTHENQEIELELHVGESWGCVFCDSRWPSRVFLHDHRERVHPQGVRLDDARYRK